MGKRLSEWAVRAVGDKPTLLEVDQFALRASRSGVPMDATMTITGNEIRLIWEVEDVA